MLFETLRSILVHFPADQQEQMSKLREAAIELGGVDLLIIDPIVSAVTGDMNKANDVRRSLQAVVDFAAEFGCAVIGITHFAKNTQGKRTTDTRARASS